MTLTRLKICGLTRAEDVASAISYGADFLGFIVEAKSARKLTVAAAAKLASPAKGIIPIVAVTVNADDELVADIAKTMAPDFIQLHGDEPSERAAEIKAKFGLKIIKALAISAPQDLAAIFAYPAADYVLLDAKAPKGAARGGHGTAFDWDMLKDVPLPEAWLLAGGLNPDNARSAAEQTKAPILDVSSGVESAPGIKDPSKIQAIIEAVKHGQS